MSTAEASLHHDAKISNDDVIHAVALALTASPLTDSVRTLPERKPEDEPGDPTGLPMEMVYAFQKETTH